MTSCLSPPLFHDIHRRERCISFEQPGELQHSQSNHFGSILWNGKVQKSLSEGDGKRDKEECRWNHMRLVKFMSTPLSLLGFEVEEGTVGWWLERGMQISYVDSQPVQHNPSRLDVVLGSYPPVHIYVKGRPMPEKWQCKLQQYPCSWIYSPLRLDNQSWRYQCC